MNERSPAERSDLFAADWASALTGAIDVSPPLDEVADLLVALAADTLAVTRDTPFQPERAAKIGAALVDASLVDPAVLGRSLTVIARQLRTGDAALATDPGRVAAVRRPWPRVTSALCATARGPKPSAVRTSSAAGPRPGSRPNCGTRPSTTR